MSNCNSNNTMIYNTCIVHTSNFKLWLRTKSIRNYIYIYIYILSIPYMVYSSILIIVTIITIHGIHQYSNNSYHHYHMWYISINII